MDEDEESPESRAFWAEVDERCASITPADTARELHRILSGAGYRCMDCWICETLQPLILKWDGPRWWIS